MMKKRINKKWKIAALLLILIFLGIQLIRPPLKNKEVIVADNMQLPDNVQQIFERACYDCHSNQTRLKWFDKIVPAYWLVANHVKDGRAALNFSEWNKLDKAAAKAKLFRAVNDIRSGEMPLSSYLLLHGNAKLSKNDIHVLEDYLLENSLPLHYDTTTNITLKSSNDKASVKPALNGLHYIDDYTDWTAISTSDRFDNGTIRIIYTNDIGVKAIREHHINPLPDGTIFAKVAWKQMKDSWGNITAGDFVQVEFMVKDGKQYSATKGWGWGRWVGKDLKPYGTTATFTTECISCHQPVKNNDYVFTYPFQLK